jgi:PAS domain S-box-containing protein
LRAIPKLRAFQKDVVISSLGLIAFGCLGVMAVAGDPFNGFHSFLIVLGILFPGSASFVVGAERFRCGNDRFGSRKASAEPNENFDSRKHQGYTAVSAGVLAASQAQQDSSKRTRLRDVFAESTVGHGESMNDIRRFSRFEVFYRWYRARVRRFHYSRRWINRWYGTLTNIKAKTATQEAFQLELNRHIDAIPILIWTAAIDGHVEHLNRRWLEYTGMDEQAAVGWGWIGAVHPDDRDELVGRWECLMVSRGPVEAEARLRRHDGEYRWFLFRAELMINSTGEPIRWYGTNTDIHDMKSAQQARASQVASLAQLSASIAHEINQPLAAVVSNSNACRRWLAVEPLDIGRVRLIAERLVRDANAAAQIVRRVRALFKDDVDARTWLNVNDVIGEVVQLLSGETSASNVTFRTELESMLPEVAADHVQLQQVLVNLFRNGIDAMRSNGEHPKILTIRSARDKLNRIMVEVRDSGAGLVEPERIFEPFFTTKAEGMGMGLALCRSILAAHGGTLSAAETESRGTSFSFTLPVQLEDGELTKSGRRVERPYRTGKLGRTSTRPSDFVSLMENH